MAGRQTENIQERFIGVKVVGGMFNAEMPIASGENWRCLEPKKNPAPARPGGIQDEVF
jgi:hypothetical protein